MAKFLVWLAVFYFTKDVLFGIPTFIAYLCVEMALEIKKDK